MPHPALATSSADSQSRQAMTTDSSPAAANPYLGWSQARINERMDALSRDAEERRPEGFSPLMSLGGATIDYMTSDERTELHLLKLALPTFAEMRLQAAERIQERIRARRKPVAVGRSSAEPDFTRPATQAHSCDGSI